MKRRIVKILVVAAILFIVVFFSLIKAGIITRAGKISMMDIDCSTKDSLLQIVYEKGFIERQKDISLKELVELDYYNASVVISILEQCGVPAKDELSSRQFAGLFMALQHVPEKDLHIKYMNAVDQMFNDSSLNTEMYVLYKDRVLVYQNLPQMYGTQVKGGKLCKVDNIDSVKIRRNELGLRPLEVYLKDLGVELEN